MKLIKNIILNKTTMSREIKMLYIVLFVSVLFIYININVNQYRVYKDIDRVYENIEKIFKHQNNLDSLQNKNIILLNQNKNDEKSR
jgi:membrane-anchored glycerophosphoryl diester phosphodiesterase (GDPDase)